MAAYGLTAQNDLDAIRYSRSGVNGTSRFTAMGGAFGALGADISCAAYNPAGLAVFRKGEMSYSGGLISGKNSVNLYNRNTSASSSGFNFNSFGFAAPWTLQSDRDSRNVFAVSVTQPVNFNNTVRLSGYTNNSSIAKDMLNLAQQKNDTNNLNYGYEGLGYNTFLLDMDFSNGKFFSNLDTKRAVLQQRTITTSGRVNDINLSFAHTYKDRFYFGGSLGLPQVRYESKTVHTEADDRDSMRVVLTSSQSYSTTYIDGLPAIYTDRLGFNNLSYTEYFKTTGSGVNIKLGGIVRVNDMLRLGVYYHTPTYYNLTDTYYNTLSVAFDKNPQSPISQTYPQTAGGGYYTYKIITPSRLGFNAAFLVKKLLAVGIDYEAVNYSMAQLQSDTPGDFDDANSLIKRKYQTGQNLRVGAELNVKPIMFRAGYNMQGSPFGDVFTGNFVRNTFSAGIGYRTPGNFFFDLTVSKMYTKENYTMFTTLPTTAPVKANFTNVSATVGFKF